MIYIFLNFLSLCFRTNDWHSEGNSCHYSYLLSVISITITIIVYLHTFVYKFCCVRAMPIWLVDNRCITINVLQLPVHYPLHAEEAYSKSTWIPKKENKGQKTSNQWRQEYFWRRIGRTQCTSAQRGQRSHQGNTVKVATFPSRSSYIDQLDKTVLSEISSSYPFFAIHECTVSFNNNCKINRCKMSFTVFNAILTFYPLEYWIDTCTLHAWHKSLHPSPGLRMWSLWKKGICNWPWLQEVSKWITYTITWC